MTQRSRTNFHLDSKVSHSYCAFEVGGRHVSAAGHAATRPRDARETATGAVRIHYDVTCITTMHAKRTRFEVADERRKDRQDLFEVDTGRGRDVAGTRDHTHAHGAIQDSMTQRATAGEHRYAPITSPSNNRYDGDTRSGELTTWTDAARYLTSIRTTRHRGALMDSAASLSSAVRGTVNAVIVACIKAARHVMSDPPNPFTPTWLATSTFL